MRSVSLLVFFLIDPSTSVFYPLSLHDALPILSRAFEKGETQGFMKILVDKETKQFLGASLLGLNGDEIVHTDRKSTRLNSSHLGISYAVFCLKKKKDM